MLIEAMWLCAVLCTLPDAEVCRRVGAVALDKLALEGATRQQYGIEAVERSREGDSQC